MNILSIDEAKKFASGKRVVIITGVTGQDGSFMADYLLKNTDFEIFGGARRLSVSNHENIEHLRNEPRFHLLNFDLTDAHSIAQVISQMKPDYFINFAAQSFVKSSWDFPVQTWEANTTSVIHILEAIRLHAPTCRFYNAGSSEEFGNVAYAPQDEKHPLRPRSPYGASKAAARQVVKVYRESYNMYAIQGWLFNHEGTRRGEEFVTRKITKGVARISKAISEGKPFEPLELGNVDVFRDWSDAEDMVDAVWRMLNQDTYNKDILPLKIVIPQDTFCTNDIELWNKNVLIPSLKEYVVSSDITFSVREFVANAFATVGLSGKWIDHEDPLKTVFETPTQTLVKINPMFYRPAEVENLLGNSQDIRTELGWSPKTDFEALVAKMVKADVARLK
jgi:GDPmannose 4,6-dehydratase